MHSCSRAQVPDWPPGLLSVAGLARGVPAPQHRGLKLSGAQGVLRERGAPPNQGIAVALRGPQSPHAYAMPHAPAPRPRARVPLGCRCKAAIFMYMDITCFDGEIARRGMASCHATAISPSDTA